MQASDTAYPRLKTSFNAGELERWYSPTSEEYDFCAKVVRGQSTRFGFLLTLKTFQRLGHFVTSDQIPDAIIDHLAKIEGIPVDREALKRYDISRSRKTHVSLIRGYLNVSPFDSEAHRLLCQALVNAALTKDDLADIVNVGIEMLVKHRYELPAFGTLLREAKDQRAATYQTLFRDVYDRLSEVDRSALDALFLVGDGCRTSPWNDLKVDAPKVTIHGLRELLNRYDQLSALAGNQELLRNIPIVKRHQLSLEGLSLDAASMADMEVKKRYTVSLALIERQLARVTDDLCDMFCKQMMKVQHLADAELEQYLTANQDKTDEILRRFAQLDTLLQSDQPVGDQIAIARQLVTARPDLCEFSRVHSEFGGKNECRFMWRYFKVRRRQLFRILAKLRWVATSQDNKSFERALAFVLANHRRHTGWLTLDGKGESVLTPQDLDWVPAKWWKLVTGENDDKAEPSRVNRRQFEVCVCRQLVQELKSADICVPGSDTYSDSREQLLSMEACNAALAEYGELVGLPVESPAFVGHVRTQLLEAANAVDRKYLSNTYFNIVNGRPVLARLTKKPDPKGFRVVEDALTQKLQALDLSMLDVLGDTMRWLNWGKFFGPLSGHESKLEDEERRQILTTFAYGTGLGPAQVAKSVSGVSDRQIAFVNQRHVTTEKLEATICEVINAYNRFWLPRLWGNAKRAGTDGTKWDLYENNLLSEYHIRYGSWGGVAYYHVSDTYIALFSHFIPCGVWEAIYILDGLTKNKSDIQPDTLHGDTQAQSTPVFGLAYLLGIKLMPRIRNWKDLKCYKPTSEASYHHIDELFTKDNINWELIARHLPDMLQIALSIKAGRIAPSTILRKLGTASRKNKLYYAFRELGRVVRTCFLLEYVNSEELRRLIQSATNRCESFNKFAQWVYFASDLIQENVRDEQLKVIKYNHLIANLLIFHNCKSMTEALKEMQDEGMALTPDILRALSPYRQHPSRFGMYELRDSEVGPIDYDVRLDLANHEEMAL
jgi:TnpA family transposase